MEGSRGKFGYVLCHSRLRLSWKVDECKPLPPGAAVVEAQHDVGSVDGGPSGLVPQPPAVTHDQGLTLAHFKAQLEDLREHIAHVRAQLEHLRATSASQLRHMGEKVSLT